MPDEVWVTLEQEKGYNSILDHGGVYLFGENSAVNETRAPSNIKFENRDYTIGSRIPRVCLLLIAIIASFIVTTLSISVLRGFASNA